jgi:hypothetical protein
LFRVRADEKTLRVAKSTCVSRAFSACAAPATGRNGLVLEAAYNANFEDATLLARLAGAFELPETFDRKTGFWVQRKTLPRQEKFG